MSGREVTTFQKYYHRLHKPWSQRVAGIGSTGWKSQFPKRPLNLHLLNEFVGQDWLPTESALAASYKSSIRALCGSLVLPILSNTQTELLAPDPKSSTPHQCNLLPIFLSFLFFCLFKVPPFPPTWAWLRVGIYWGRGRKERDLSLLVRRGRLLSP